MPVCSGYIADGEAYLSCLHIISKMKPASCWYLEGDETRSYVHGADQKGRREV